MKRSLVSILTVASLLGSGFAHACSLAKAPRNQPEFIDPVPYAVFEARVIEIHDANVYLHPELTPETYAKGQEGVIEVVRSFHGPFKPGEQVATSTVTGGGSCGVRVTVGTRVVIWSDTAPPFKIWSALRGSEQPSNVFAELALVPGPARHSKRADLANVLIRGHLSDRTAAKLLVQAQPAQEECSVVGATHYAEVRCGEAFGGNDARFKVIFHRVLGRWVEVMRWEAPGTSAEVFPDLRP